MAFYKKTIREVDLRGKKVLLRADYNVPVSGGRIEDDYRIKQSLPTLHYLLEQRAIVVIISHMGRPEGKKDPASSLKPVAERLGELLGAPVAFAADCLGERAAKAAQKLNPGEVLLLENLRFYPQEEANDEQFARELLQVSGAEFFVQDGFGVVHRAHASTEAIARQNVMAISGLLLEREVETITRVMQQPERPLAAIIGGAKISDKIEVLNRLIDIADVVAVGGAMANNFLLAEGLSLGKSLVEAEALDVTKDILKRARQAEKQRPFHFLVPSDVVASRSPDGSLPTRVVDLSGHVIADIEAYPKLPPASAHQLAGDELALDIGPLSAGRIAGVVHASRTVLWNGTLGVAETAGINGAQAPFAHATRVAVEAMVGRSRRHANRPFSVAGGGDTVAYIQAQLLSEDFDHLSTGGGTSLELMAGRNLPGVEVLWDKD